MLGGANAAAGVTIITIVMAMGLAWVFRVLLIRVLRNRHPGEFAALGSPTIRQLSSLLPKHQNLYLTVWKYLWGGRVFRLNDPLVSSLGLVALASDVVLLGAVVFLFWSARH